MLEIFATRMETSGTRTIPRLENVNQIEKDCWINMVGPNEEEIAKVREHLDLPPEFIGYSLD